MKDLSAVRSQFSFFEGVNKGVIYFDNAATSLRPRVVVERLTRFYEVENSNVHRGTYKLSQKATENFEKARKTLAKFFGAEKAEDLVFTRGTTESMNLFAYSWGEKHLQEGDLVIVSRMDHHSSFVPLQQLALRKKARFKIIELDSTQKIDLNEYKLLLKEKPKIVCFPHISNTLGIINPVQDLSVMAKKAGACVIVDGAQSGSSVPVSFKDWTCVDFFSTSAHKMGGPTGLGCLIASEKRWKEMDPFIFGGSMISEVKDQDSSWNELPWRFEAGTPSIAQVLAWEEAALFVESVGWGFIKEQDEKLREALWAVLKACPYLKVIGVGNPQEHMPSYSFYHPQIHAQDLASYLDQEGVCVRVGHHCTDPLMRSLGIEGTLRVSLSYYNSIDELKKFQSVLKEALDFFEKRLQKKGGTFLKKLPSEQELLDWLRPLKDPEMNISLVDLGLIYKVEINEKAEVHLDMTLTSPACPMAQQIVTDVHARLLLHPHIIDAKVNLVWQPAWNPKEMASEEAKEELDIW